MSNSPSPQDSSSSVRHSEVLRENAKARSGRNPDEADAWSLEAGLDQEMDESTKKHTGSEDDSSQERLNAQLKQENEELKSKIVCLASAIMKLQSRNERQTKDIRRMRSQVDKAKKLAGEVQQVSNPNTLEGQQVGAILKIKKVTQTVKWNNFAVGDHVEVLDSELDGTFVRNMETGLDGTFVRNMRSGQEACISWESFFPVSRMGTCYCLRSGDGLEACRCIHEDSKNTPGLPIQMPKDNNPSPSNRTILLLPKASYREHC